MARQRRYHVDFTATAKRDLHSIRDLIAQENPKAAKRWLRRIESQVDFLELMPYSHEVIPEGDELEVDCRHIISGNYRVIYQVEENRVIILRIVHAARLLTRRMLLIDRPERQ